MDRFPISQGNNSQYASLKLINHAPKPKTVVFLGLNLEGIFDNLDAPFFFEIQSLSQHFIFEILGESIIGHCLFLHCIFVSVHYRFVLDPFRFFYTGLRKDALVKLSVKLS